MPFHVFIERAVDPTPDGRQRLAAAIAQRFRLPPAQVTQYLSQGRFRVKSGADEATARKFVAELTTLGAVVTVEDAATGAKVAMPPAAPTAVASPPPPAARSAAKPSVPPPLPPGALAAKPAATPAPVPAGAARGGAAPNAAAPVVAPSGQKFESGLAAAFAAPAAGPDAGSFGALSALDNLAGVSLSSLDGAETDTPTTGPSAAAPPVNLDARAFEAPDADTEDAIDVVEVVKTPKPEVKRTPLPQPAQPPPKRTPLPHAAAAAPPGGADEMLDLLNPPPEAAEAGEAMPLAGDLLAVAETPTSAGAVKTPRPRPAYVPIEGGPLARHFVGKPRLRILAGVALALLLGFIPAEIYASSAEASRYSAIRTELIAAQQGITTQEQYDGLDAPDGYRTLAQRSLERARGRVRVNMGLLWIVVTGGLSWVWFKKLA